MPFHTFFGCQIHSEENSTSTKNQFSISSKKSNLKEDKKDILENTDPEVIEKYNQLLEKDLDEVNEVIKSAPTKKSQTEEVYELPRTNAKVVVMTNDEVMEDTEKASNDSMVSTQAINVDYGTTHRYTVNHNITAYAYPDSTASLVTVYRASSGGLDAQYASTAGTNSYIPTSISGPARVTDSSADQLGHDINAAGTYSVTIGGYEGIGLVTFDMDITSTIKWDTKRSTSAYVERSYNVYGDESP